MNPQSTFLIRGEDGTVVPATLLGGLRPSNLELVERVWSKERQQLLRELLIHNVDRSKWPQSLHWNWEVKASELRLLAYQGWAIECEGDFQGLMMLELGIHFSRNKADTGKPLVYIEYLEAAPWNWDCSEIGQSKRYRGIGQILFQKAVELSFAEGFSGRVGLHALPQAEGFYVSACGMARFDPDPDKENLVYFELSGDAALARFRNEASQ